MYNVEKAADFNKDCGNTSIYNNVLKKLPEKCFPIQTCAKCPYIVGYKTAN